jgi:hypothetical protein
MRPTSATMIRMKDSELFNFKRLLPSMVSRSSRSAV